MADIDTQHVAVLGMFAAVLVTVLAPASTDLTSNFNWTPLDERPNCQMIAGSYVAAEVNSEEEFGEFGSTTYGATFDTFLGSEPGIGVVLVGTNTTGAYISQTFDEYSVGSGRGPLEAVNVTASTGAVWENNVTVQYRTALNVFKEVTLPHNMSSPEDTVRVSAEDIDGNYLPLYMRIELERASGEPSPLVDILEVIHDGYDPGTVTSIQCYTDTVTSYTTAILTLDIQGGDATLLHEVLRVAFGVMSIVVIVTVAKLLSIVLPVIG